jgi:hypothetical protein
MSLITNYIFPSSEKLCNILCKSEVARDAAHGAKFRKNRHGRVLHWQCCAKQTMRIHRHITAPELSRRGDDDRLCRTRIQSFLGNVFVVLAMFTTSLLPQILEGNRCLSEAR